MVGRHLHEPFRRRLHRPAPRKPPSSDPNPHFRRKHPFSGSPSPSSQRSAADPRFETPVSANAKPYLQTLRLGHIKAPFQSPISKPRFNALFEG
eukprot:2710575-Rhodomonas_salina.1